MYYLKDMQTTLCKIARLQDCKKSVFHYRHQPGNNRLVFGNKWLLLGNNRLILERRKLHKRNRLLCVFLLTFFKLKFCGNIW